METTLIYRNIHDNSTSTKVLTFVGSIGNCHNVWKSDKGEHYTKGIAGWINIDNYIGK